MRRRGVFLSPIILIAVLSAWCGEQMDLNVVHRIKEEAFDHSQVMDHLFYLSEVAGPRLTGTPGFKQAADWAVQRLHQFGVTNAHLESVGDATRSWRLTDLTLNMTEPQYTPLIGVVMAGSGSTNGVVTGEPILAPLAKDRDADRYEAALKAYMEKYRGKLRGRIVLAAPLRRVDFPTTPETTRYSDAELRTLSDAAPVLDPEHIVYPTGTDFLDFYLSIPRRIRIPIGRRNSALNLMRNRFYRDEGAAVVLFPDATGQGGTVFADNTGILQSDEAPTPPMITLTPEHFNRIYRLAERQIPVRLAINVQTELSPKRVEAFNVVGEIPGGRKKDEIVLIGGHLDSWTFGTGATDNGAGSAVMIEVMRILKTLELPLDRTVRIALWCSEELGHQGSKGYVKRHLIDENTLEPKPEYARHSVYFNLDDGSGKIRGVYLQGSEAARPLLANWSAVFSDQGMTATSIRTTGGSDHETFDTIGIPGFIFIQDLLNYNTRTHHTNMDTYDYVSPSDLKQAAAIIASFAYQASNRPELFPRKPAPSKEDRAAALK